MAAATTSYARGSRLNPSAHPPSPPLPSSPSRSSPEPEGDDDLPTGLPKPWPAGPLQKRRRVTRACDECRRKKIKCDGKQPCAHCTVYSYDCTYDQPSNRRRNPTPQYIEALENRLQRAETILRTVLPNVDLNDPDLEAVVRQSRPGTAPPKAPPQSDATAGSSQDSTAVSEQDAQLRSMIESTGQLDIDESGHWDFHGGSSGAVFVRRMREQFGCLLGNDHAAPVFPRIPRPPRMAPIFDSPRSTADSPIGSDGTATLGLPSREMARALCSDSLNCACALLRFVHQPTFYEMFDRIYDIPPEDFRDDEHRFLPLLYSILALGCMFHLEPVDARSDAPQTTYKASIEQGFKYFRAARQLMDITDCRDLTSLEAILFMILFLQSSANLSTCYSYIGIALRSSLRMGLHRNLAGNFNPIERETRRRIFWIVRKMDTYVSALLGFPQMLSYDDIDQELPTETDDEYITRDAILPMPEGHTSLYSASNAHTRLMATLAKVIKYIYPTKGLEQSVKGCKSSSYVVSHAKIKEIERDLADWLDKLPMALRPGGDASADWLRMQQLLRLSYAHVQMMLYRPFLHYVSQKQDSNKTVDERSYACAAAGVSVSRNIVHITTEMEKRGLLIGAHWFTMYTTFFAVLSLVYFVLENQNKSGSEEILADAYAGKNALGRLARRSQAADRCSTALKGLFEQLPKRLRKGSNTAPAPSKKKRSAVSPKPSPSSRGRKSLDSSGLGPRAMTFPAPALAPVKVEQVQRSSFDSVQFPLNTNSNPNLRRSYHELMSPTTLSESQTPDSSNSSNMPLNALPQQPFPFENPLLDVNAMMFPSADPFAYPNQPFTPFETLKPDTASSGANIDLLNDTQASQMYLSNGLGTNNSCSGQGQGQYDDLEGQIFGPLPPYLMQGQSSSGYEMQGQMGGTGNLQMDGMEMQGLAGFHSGLTPGEGGVRFDEVFGGGGEEWLRSLEEAGWRG